MKNMKNKIVGFGAIFFSLLGFYILGLYTISTLYPNPEVPIPDTIHWFATGISSIVLLIVGIENLIKVFGVKNSTECNTEYDDITTHEDFKRYYSTSQKRNIWALGYFGGGSIDISEAMEVAKKYADEVGVPLNTVRIDELLSSRRFKGFKIIYSCVNNQKCKGEDTTVMDNVYEFLRD